MANSVSNEPGPSVLTLRLSHPQLVLYFSALAYVSLPMFPGILEYGSQNLRIIKDAKIQHPPAADGIAAALPARVTAQHPVAIVASFSCLPSSAYPVPVMLINYTPSPLRNWLLALTPCNTSRPLSTRQSRGHATNQSVS